MLSGSDWRSRQQALIPGSVARLERDADTFFLRDIPALLGWQYGADDAARVAAPVLYVGGTDSGSWFRQTRAWVQSLFPEARSVMIDRAGHDLALTHPTELASAITDFIAAADGGRDSLAD
jgi:pimeloyl-ACP methyl ester carboxylesterase